MRPLLAFDMNGTLLDTGVLDPFCATHFGSALVRREWFFELISLSNLAQITGYYEPFLNLAKAALDVIAHRYKAKLSAADRTEFERLLKSLPAFPDVIPALQRLAKSKFRMVVLTNSPASNAESLIFEAKLRDYFETIISSDTLQIYKPDRRVYQGAATQMQINPSQLMLVAAHAWDTTGAIRAGCQAAFIARPGEVLPPNAPPPQIVAADMNDLSDRLCRDHAG